MISLIWISPSPDLNPIEALWKKIKEKVNKKHLRLTTQRGVCNAITEAWENITAKDILELIDSMPKRVEAVIDANGGNTKF